MNGLTELERQQQPHKSRLFPSLQDKYLPVFFYFISAILIVFDFSLSLRRLSPPGCCCINVGTREKKNAERTFQQQHHLFVSVARACRRRECGLTIRQMYILFVVMIWQSNEIFSLRCCCWFRLPNEIQRHSLEMGELSFTPQSHITQSRFQSLFFSHSIPFIAFCMKCDLKWRGKVLILIPMYKIAILTTWNRFSAVRGGWNRGMKMKSQSNRMLKRNSVWKMFYCVSTFLIKVCEL